MKKVAKISKSKTLRKKENKKIIGFSIGALFITGASIFAIHKINKKKNGSASPKNDVTEAGVISNFDSIYDYKYINGTWFFRKKGTTQFIDMSKTLNPFSYDFAAKRLQKYL